MEAARGFRQELGGGGKIKPRGKKRFVAEIGCQKRQLDLQVGTLTVPLQQAMASKSMTNVMNAWAFTAMATAFPAY
jgi:hypothetical protein